MNWKRLRSFYNYSISIWLLAPLVFNYAVSNYPNFIVAGLVFAAGLSLVFYKLDVATDRALVRVRAKK